jgi:hypothetical protein
MLAKTPKRKQNPQLRKNVENSGFSTTPAKKKRTDEGTCKNVKYLGLRRLGKAVPVLKEAPHHEDLREVEV